MRATFSWILTLTSGFTAFMVVAILALLPMEVAKNRAVYRVVDQYAHRLAEAKTLPRNAAMDDAYSATIEGIRAWPSLPGGCQDTAFEGSSDRFVLGFWENGSRNPFGATWWHCYAYPSGKTTLEVSLTDYLTGAAGWQVLVYALIAAITGCAARLLQSGSNCRSLKPSTRAIWFGAFMTVVSLMSVIGDFGDDQFWENPEYVKWFVLVLKNTLWPIYERLPFISGSLSGSALTLLAFGMWSAIGWSAGRLVSLARTRLRTA